MPAACSLSGKLSIRKASMTISCVADAVAPKSAAANTTYHGARAGSEKASSTIETISRSCENKSEPQPGGEAEEEHDQHARLEIDRERIGESRASGRGVGRRGHLGQLLSNRCEDTSLAARLRQKVIGRSLTGRR